MGSGQKCGKVGTTCNNFLNVSIMSSSEFCVLRVLSTRYIRYQVPQQAMVNHDIESALLCFMSMYIPVMYQQPPYSKVVVDRSCPCQIVLLTLPASTRDRYVPSPRQHLKLLILRPICSWICLPLKKYLIVRSHELLPRNVGNWSSSPQNESEFLQDSVGNWSSIIENSNLTHSEVRKINLHRILGESPTHSEARKTNFQHFHLRLILRRRRPLSTTFGAKAKNVLEKTQTHSEAKTRFQHFRGSSCERSERQVFN